MQFEELDWVRWSPDERATLIFVIRSAEILLIHKKRGLGAGKITGPGGKLHAGETALACALREIREEVGVRVREADPAGELHFQFTDGYRLSVTVFSATGCDGEPRETEEAVPMWVSLDAIPYGRMWADDVLWMPLMLAGRSFSGHFLFQGDRMLGHRIDLHP